MESYSKKQLSGINVNMYCDTAKLYTAKDLGTHISKRLRYNYIRILGADIVLLPIAVFLIISNYEVRATLLMAAGLIIFTLFDIFANPGRQYREWKENGTFYRIDSSGISRMVKSKDGRRFVRADDIRWEFIVCVKFYDDYIIVTKKVQKLETPESIYLHSEDMERDKRAILVFWAKHVHHDDVCVPDVYSEKDMTEIENFINTRFGKSESVLHEWISPDIHVDIVIIPPAKERNYYTLCTMGAGTYTMNVPETDRVNNNISDHAEYLIYLPADWDLSGEGLKDERNFWPIRQLKIASRGPIYSNEYMSWGHTQAYENEAPFAFNTAFNATLLLSPAPYSRRQSLCSLPSGITVEFFQLFPITPDELAMKKGKHGAEKLLKAIEATNQGDTWPDFAVKRQKQMQAPYAPHPYAEPYKYKFLQVPYIEL